MKNLNLNDVLIYVENNIGFFHEKKLKSLDTLRLTKILKRKNPYLFKAKYLLTSEQIIKGLVDAHISSNEETIFGDWLEGLAIYINHQVFNGRKSGIKGIDLEFENADKKYIVAIKSGPNWGNSGQIKNMRADFKSAARTLRTSNANLNIVAINGCCYGIDNKPDKGDYFKYCGQQFWKFISGNDNLFTEIVQPLGHQAKEHNDSFAQSYARILNKFTSEFTNLYCDSNGDINWPKLIQFNSGSPLAK